MARILLTSFGSYGDVHPTLGLALALRRRGHAPVLALPEYYRADSERHGLDHRAVRPDIDLDDRVVLARIMRLRAGPAYLFERVLIPALRDSYQDLDDAARGTDLIVTHPAVPAGPVVAEVRGLPWVSMVLAPMSLFSVYDPIVPPPAPGLHALISRSRVLGRLVLRAADRVSRRWTAPVRALRMEKGLAPGANPFMAGQHSPYLVLGLFSSVLAEPQADWPGALRVTGAIPFNGRAGSHPLPAGLRAFLDRGDPPVVFTLGSSAVAAAGAFYREGAAAVRRLGRRGVLLAGRHAENVREIRTGDDILVVEWADHATLFPRAAAIVHQAGAGTLHQALRSARPQLAVPHAFDQPDNAMRAVRLGVARTLPARRFQARRAAAHLAALLDDPAYGRRATDVAAVVRAERGADAACDAIDAVLAGLTVPR